jgi:nickel transport protein
VCGIRRATIIFLVVAIFGLMVTRPAFAHQLHLFTWVKGTTICGEAYFGGGTPARDAKITLTAPDGEELGQATTNAKGEFSVAARRRCDYKVVVDAGDGHVAESRVVAIDLPDSLPGLPGTTLPGPATTSERMGGTSLSGAKGVVSDQSTAFVPQGVPPDDKLDQIQRQVVQLQRQVDPLADKTQLRDILGALGVLFGMMGLTFYFLGVRRRDRG